MIVCSNCGNAMEDNLPFCTECGTAARQAEQTHSIDANSNQQTVALTQSLPPTAAWPHSLQRTQISSQPTQPANFAHNPALMFALIAAVALLALLVGGGAVWVLKPSHESSYSSPPTLASPERREPPANIYDSLETSVVNGEEISSADLAGMSYDDLRRLRNAVYARHGRLFDSPELQRYFDSRAWYKRRSDYSDGELTEIDKANANLIMDVEKGAR